jgi:hypothetical protein
MPNEPKSKPPEVGGIREAEFQLWKHHPVTKVVMKYLDDYRGAMTRQIVQAWEAGALKLTDDLEGRGRSVMLREVTSMDFDVLATFYGVEQESDSNAIEEDSSE